MKGIVPDRVLVRTRKAKLGGNLDRNLVKKDWGLLRQQLYGEARDVFRYVNKDVIEEAFERVAGRSDSSSVKRDDIILIYTFGMLSLWLKREGDS